MAEKMKGLESQFAIFDDGRGFTANTPWKRRDDEQQQWLHQDRNLWAVPYFATFQTITWLV